MSPRLVDWKLAAATGTRLVPPGPTVSLSEAVATVDDLKRVAAEADRYVADITGLDAASDSATTVVVDRPAWIRANVDSFALLTDPLIDKLIEKRGSGLAGGVTVKVGSKVTGVEVGVLLSYLGTKVLGQFELLGPARTSADERAPGRLTLVAPNMLAAERALAVDPADFRLWVCLHEVTHRTQFAAAPWLHAHVQELLGEFLLASDLDTSALIERLRSALTGLAAAARGKSGLSIVELIQTPEQKVILDRLTGLMSLLEGHADVIMDLVGPEVVPSVETIRSRFDARRRDASPLGKVFRRLVGMEMKMKQYAEGAQFVRAVIDEVGMAGLNIVWTSAELLPSGDEIRNPNLWLERTSGYSAVSA